MVEQIERRTLAERQICAVLKAAGAEDIDEPNVVEARADFDAALVAAPVPESKSARLLRELGI